MKDLVAILPNIITYAVIGYIFRYVYIRMAFSVPTKDINSSLTLNFIIGYIYYSIMEFFVMQLNMYRNNCFYVLTSIIVAFVLARLSNTRFVQKIKKKLGFNETGNQYFWDEITDWVYPSKIKVLINGFYIEGFGYKNESFTNDPHIILSSYIISDKNGNEIFDYSNDETRNIIIDCKKCDWVEHIYDKESKMCEPGRNLVKTRKNFQ